MDDNEILVIKTSKDWSNALSMIYSYPEKEFILKLEPPEGKPGYITICEYFCAPEFHSG